MRVTGHIRKVAQKLPRQIDQVNALIEQFAAPRPLRIGPPLAIVTNPAAVSIASAHKHHLTQSPGDEQLARLDERRMVAVVKAHTHLHAGLFGRRQDWLYFAHSPGRGLLDEHMLAGLYRGQSDLG